MQPHGVLRVEHGISRIHRRFQHVGRQGQFRTLFYQPFQQRAAVALLERLRQTRVRSTDQLKDQECGVLDRGMPRAR
ncbi:MAG: hypothetical protein KatS3mg082_2841 [Nitrospiraceae bacterium]|nr:MAG: hypothetical protein KatS3mg082_2841 [Nitrospiraceae bacterium]